MAKRKTKTKTATKTERLVIDLAPSADAPIDPMAAAAPKCPACGRAHMFGTCW